MRILGDICSYTMVDIIRIVLLIIFSVINRLNTYLW